MRHRRVDVLVDRHLLLDGPFHPHEADPELVLEKLADATDAAVPEVVDVVDLADVPLELQERVDDDEEVVGGERLLVEGRREPHPDVELVAAHAREVVFARVEEHPDEEVLGALVRRRIAGAHPLVDLQERFALRLDGVLPEGGDEGLADRLPLGKENLDRGRLLLRHDRGEVVRDLASRLVEDLA